jgi:hypothetical protein
MNKEEIKKELLKKIDKLARKYMKEEDENYHLEDFYAGTLNAIHDIEEIIKKL